MIEIDDETFKKNIKEISGTINDLVKALEHYVWNEDNKVLKDGYQDLINRAKEMENNMDEIILNIAVKNIKNKW